MTVSSAIATQTFTCDGFTTAFTCPFRVLEASELVGYLITVATNASVPLVNGTDFAVTGVGAANAVATTTLIYSSAYQVNFRRRTQRLQLTDYRDNDPFPAESHENTLDRQMHISQEADTDIARALLVPEPETGITLPSAEARANYVLGFDASGAPVAVVLVSGSAAALAMDLINDTNAIKGAGQLGYGAAVAYASGVGLQLRKAGINLAAWPGVDPTGASDTSAAIRLAMAEATSSGRPLYWNSGTYIVSPDPASPVASGFFTYCLKPADSAVWIMTAGATIKQAAGAQSWCRVVSFQECDGVRVFGELRVDANAQNRGGTVNEHMHGVFMFNTSNSHFDRIHSINAVGDNIFIGGTSEATYGDNISIGSVYAKTAGRKNLVFHYCDNLQVGSAILDNSAGGSLVGGAADATEKHCFDVEPDSFTGSRRFVQSVGRLETYGLGNDFTAGTTPTHADNWIVNIGSAKCVQSGSSATVPAWIQYGITVNIGGALEITGCAGIDNAIDLLYAARLNGERIVITGASATAGGYLMSASTAGSDENRPELNLGSVVIENTAGHGMNLRSVVGTIGTLKAKCAGYALEVGDNVSSASYRGSMVIDHLITRDTGVATTGAVVSLVTYAIAGYALTVRKITALDTRGTKTGALFQVAAGNAAGLVIGEAVNPEAIPLVNWLSTDKFYRLGGSYYTATNTGPAQYVCFGTPESMVSAMIGSTAMRQDGGASTSLYVKQSGTGNTGWVGK